jgi:hypothetical protein
LYSRDASDDCIARSAWSVVEQVYRLFIIPRRGYSIFYILYEEYPIIFDHFCYNTLCATRNKF